jgi:hypothetical protein
MEWMLYLATAAVVIGFGWGVAVSFALLLIRDPPKGFVDAAHRHITGAGLLIVAGVVVVQILIRNSK